MGIVTGYVFLHQARFYAFHGVLPQEQRVGGDYMVSVKVGYPLAAAAESDEVSDTLNYAALYSLVKQEMAQPSKLLEHVAGRIIRSTVATFPQVLSVDVELTKLNPPMGADCEGAGVEMHWEKDPVED